MSDIISVPLTELAWQAGMVDGEGTVTIERQIRKDRPSPAFRPMINITNTNRNLVTPFKAVWVVAFILDPITERTKTGSPVLYGIALISR